MRNRFNGMIKRIVSGLSAIAVMTSNILPFTPLTARAEAAHTINVFDIDLKAGADYYSTYTPDDPASGGMMSLDGVYVWQADNSNAGHKFVYNIKLSISGEGNSNNGEMTDERFIQIRIPEHILRFSDSSTSGNTDTVEMPVPNISQIEYKEVNGVKVYATNHQFVYEYDSASKEYIIYNIAPVSAGVVYEFPVAYVMEKNTWEYPDLGASDPFVAKVEIHSWEKRSDDTDPIVHENLNQTTREIPVYVDTGAKITKTVKKADAVLIDADHAKAKMGLPGDLDENYKYVVWSVSSDIADVTQKYALNLLDNTTDLTGNDADGTAHTITGEIVAVKMGSQFFQGEALANCELTGLTASGKRTDYVLTRYAKSDVDDLENHSKPAVYTASNDVTVKLTPADGQDRYTEKPGNAAFQYEVKDPEWLPLEVGFTSDKWGLYNNGKSHVSSKTNISSYSMNDLTTDGETVSGLKYETKSTAHAYSKTIADLNHEITSLVTTENQDGTFTIAAGNRTYVFNASDASAYVLNGVSQTISGDYPAPLSKLNMQRIVAQDIADRYYGQKALDYILDDKTFSLSDVNDASAVTPLGKDDYKIDSIDYAYLVRHYVYDAENMEFSAGEDNAYIQDESQNILAFYVYNDGAETPVLVGNYNILTETSSITDPALVSSLTADSITFAGDANITGYQIRTSNKYFYVELKTKPSVTLKASATVRPVVQEIVSHPETKEQKIAVNNTCNWTVKNDSTELLNTDRTGTDYIADIIRKSSISKKALGEKTNITGQDGKTYRSRNDTLAGQYELAWQSRIAETADGVEVNGALANNVPVVQQSGIFYDLLPSHCDIIEGSVNVYADAGGDVNADTTALPPSSFEVLDRIDNYNNSGKKLLVIKIHAPCNSSYTVTYVTVHSHEDIQDYGSFALNTVAYQTGNADIGDGYPDDGGNYAVSMSAYIKGLDPDNGTAKRFIYAEATEDILALFPTSSGIYKKVATQNDPTYRKTGVVHNGETYTYSIRMQNDSSTKATDIAILDSVENYRTVTGAEKAINSGLTHDRDWNGTVVSFDLQGIEDKMGADYKNDLKLILYTGSDPVNLDDEQYSEVGDRKYILYKVLGLESKAAAAAAELTAAEIADYDAIAAQWIVADNWKAPSNVTVSDVTAFIVYTGERFVLSKGDSLSFTVKMQAPDTVSVSGTPDVENGVFLTPPKTYNNVYRSFTSSLDTTNVNTYFYTHYDYTQVQYSTVGTLKFSKRDAVTGETIPGVTFNLSGISDYGTAYNETLTSDGNGVVTFKNLERGTYQLIESISDDDHQLDAAPRTVMVDPQGMFTFLKMDGTPMLTLDANGNIVINGSDNEDIEIDANGNFSIKNDPRYHGDLAFRKVDSLSGEGISGTKFTLSGTSIYNTVYHHIEAESDANGNVVFENIEKGTYTLTETAASDGYLPPADNVYQVTSSGARDLVFKITGENIVNAGTEYQIKNIPTAEMTLQKVDAVTKDTLDDASFTLTADHSVGSLLDDAIPKLTAQGIFTNWVNSSGSWIQTVNGSISSGTGRYVFSYLPEGTYTLAESTPPTHYEANTAEYTIRVVKSTDGKKLVIKLPSGKSEWEYIRLENGEFAAATADTALYQRLGNNESYEDDKTVIKSWIGSVDGSFPSLHLSTEKPEVVAKKVTIGTQLKSLIGNNKANITAFEKANSLPTGITEDTIPSAFMDNDSGETGKFYAWYDNGKIKWWSNADITYMPADCSELFKNCTKLTSADFSDLDFSKVTNMSYMFNGCSSVTTLDLTAFNTANVTTMEGMFKSCKVLTTITLDYTKFTAADKLTTVKDMFNGCENLAGIDLRGFGNCENLNSIENWFYNCKKITYIDLSNFNTSEDTLSNIKGIFYYVGQGLSGNPGTNTGTKVFAKQAWDFSDTALYNYSAVDWMRINLYGIMYKNNAEDGKPGNPSFTIEYARTHFQPEYQNPPPTNGLTGSNLRTTGGYFNPAYIQGTTEFISNNYSEFYKEFCLSTYGSISTATNQSGNSSASTPITTPTINTDNITFANYPNFTKSGSVTQAENTAATTGDIGKTTFRFEYVTDNAAVPTSGTAPYEVDETIYLTVSQIVEDSKTYYTVSQKYKYNGTAKAKWTGVGGSAPAQWKCEMQVFDADDEFFAWEDKVNGYTSTADDRSPIKTVGRSNEPVITNVETGTKVGNLELSKLLTGGKEKYSKDTFTFKVTMKNADNSAYTMLPFDESGVAYFNVKPNAKDEDKVIIKGIPENCTYTVEEVGINGEKNRLNGAYTVSSSTGLSGTIAANNPKKAEITNTINTADLSLTKNVVLKKNTAAEPTVYTEAASSDEDYMDWADEDFTFTVTFENLVVGQEYTYEIGGIAQSDKIVGSDESAETVKTITIKGGQTVVFKNIPTGTNYTIVETSDFVNTESVTYTTENDKGTLRSTGEQTITAADAVTFTNTKQIDETLIPEYVKVTVNKKWYSEDDLEVHWMTNSEGKAVKFRFDETTNAYVEDDDKGAYIPMDSNNQILSNYPSFLKVYLGRALAVPRTETVGGEQITKYTYLDVVQGYTSASLNVKGGWSSTFSDLDKYGEIMEYNAADGEYKKKKYPYVYFVSEVVPIGFSNINTQTKTTIGDGEYFIATGSDDQFGFTFTNKEDATFELSVSKLVTGNLGNKAKDFTFEVRFTKSDGTALSGTGFTMQFTDLYDSTYVRNRTYTLENGKLNVELPHGKKVSFLSLPANTSYTITEINGDGYEIHSGIYSGDALDIDVSTLTGGNIQKGTLSADTSYLYVNELTGNVPTGIRLSATAATTVFILISGCIVYLLIRRRKEKMTR